MTSDEPRRAATPVSPPIDLGAYLDRVGHTGPLGTTHATLAALQAAHMARVPFENVDVRLGRPIRLDLDSLQAKLVRGRRGGFCFEQNTLFAAVLRAVGFRVHTLEARVRPPEATAPLPRTHMTLRVDFEGRSWISDVGFGADGPLHPVPLDGAPSEQPGGTYRVAREEADVLVLRRGGRGGWRDLYAFTLRPALPIDYEVACYFTATHPGSPFVKTLTVQRSEYEVRHILRGRTYTERRGGEETTREIPWEEIPALVHGPLGLELPEDEVLQALGDV